MYLALKALHTLGVVMLIGNVTFTAFWKLLSDWTRNPVIIAHAQSGVTIADLIFTSSGIALILIGAYGAPISGSFHCLGRHGLSGDRCYSPFRGLSGLPF